MPGNSDAEGWVAQEGKRASKRGKGINKSNKSDKRQERHTEYRLGKYAAGESE